MKMAGIATALLLAGILAAAVFWLAPLYFAPPAPALAMTIQNAGEVFNLDKAQRQAMQERCEAVYHKYKDEFGTLHIGKPEDVERNVTAFGKQSCSCLLRELEKRATVLQFNLAMQSEFRAGSRGDYGIFSYDTNMMDEIAPAAAAIGIDQRRFEQEKAYAVQRLSKASDTCSAEQP